MITIHAELTASGSTIVLVGVGPSVDVASTARQLATCTPLISKAEGGALTMPATWPGVVQLAHTFGGYFKPGPTLTEWAFDQEERRRLDYQMTYANWEPPRDLTPFPWQWAGAEMINRLGKVLITDEAGTGKTITAILGLVERRGNRPVLVVCPASVVDPWVDAWRTWVPHIDVTAWRGTPKTRHELAGTAEVYVTSYDTARIDADKLTKLGADSVVIDECHLIKSPTAQRSRAVRRLAKHARNVVALSGTPITHNPSDLWPTLVAMEPDAWPSRERWINRYCETGRGDYSDTILGLHPYREPEFRITLKGQHRRVAKADVLAHLPEKVYSVRTVTMPAEWRKVYDDFEAKMLAELPDGGELSVMSVLSQLTLLSRLACAAADVEITTEVDDYGNERESVHLELKAPSWKVDALLEVMEERPGQPVVCFAPSRQLAMLAKDAAEEAGLSVGAIVGGQTMKTRTATIEQFQNRKLDLVCATTGAGGTGITLTAANTAVFLQRPWSLVEAIQAEDRCHRIGSEIHDSVEIIDIVASNTIDTRVRAVLRDKAAQLADVVQDPRLVAQLLGGASVTRIPARKVS